LLSTYSLAWAILPSDEFHQITQTFGNTTVNEFDRSIVRFLLIKYHKFYVD